MSSENRPRYVEEFIGFHPSRLRRVLHMLGKLFKRRQLMQTGTADRQPFVDDTDYCISIPYFRRPGKEP